MLKWCGAELIAQSDATSTRSSVTLGSLASAGALVGLGERSGSRAESTAASDVRIGRIPLFLQYLSSSTWKAACPSRPSLVSAVSDRSGQSSNCPRFVTAACIAGGRHVPGRPSSFRNAPSAHRSSVRAKGE